MLPWIIGIGAVIIAVGVITKVVRNKNKKKIQN